MNQPNNAPVILPQSGLPDGSSPAGNKGRQPEEVASGEDTEELQYGPVPPKRTVMLSVHYRIRGRGQPLPYALDEGDSQ